MSNLYVQQGFDIISTLEIANAAMSLIKKDAPLSDAELRRRVLQQFGRKKASKAANAQIALGLAYGKSSGRLLP